MDFERIQIDPKVTRRNQGIERVLNRIIRKADKGLGFVGLGGMKGSYDDAVSEFHGVEDADLRRKHYDKSLRLLWKAQEHAPWTKFRDCTKYEENMVEMASRSISSQEREEIQKISSQEYKEMLNREYTQEQKQAIVNVLAAIQHGEAYAWMVSSEVLRDVKGTGARAALTMQVFEEAKHFVVLRALVDAFECPVPRMSVWEYLLLERTLRAKGLEKFFGMNVLVEGFALSLFGMMSHFPGLEILRLFHLDESRHTALPKNYFGKYPMSAWQKHDPRRRMHRFSLVLPAIPMLMHMEPDLAELGIDSFEFGGSMGRKILILAHQAGFYMPMTPKQVSWLLNTIFNSYCKATRDQHETTDYLRAETTFGVRERQVEREVFGAGAHLGSAA